MERLKNLLLYAGLDKDEYALLAEEARAQNEKNLKTYTLIATLVFAGLIVVNLFVSTLADINQRYYAGMLATNLLIYVGIRFLAPKRPGLVMPLCYLFMAALYLFSLILTVIHPEMPAVTTIVLLFAVPFLMIDRPIRLVAKTVIATAALCWVAIRYKSDEVMRIDLWNGLSFAGIAVCVETLQQCTKFRMLAQARKIRLLGEKDLLTGVKNRNHYENRLAAYADACQTSLVCVYVDVNGLHELNDTKGHKAGDAMLQAVAHELSDCFGADDTYRIGGDEFVCFHPDAPEYAVRASMERINARLAGQGYNISSGVASQVKSELDMGKLIAVAEREMYRAKREYYEQTGFDRRRH